MLMFRELEASPKRLVVRVAFLGLLSLPIALRAQLPGPIEAEFRGCDAVGWCCFLLQWPSPAPQSVQRVRPDGVLPATGDDALSRAVRDRLNALLASMIHQHKRIQLHALRALDDGTLAATVTVNGMDVASDPELVKLRDEAAGAIR